LAGAASLSGLAACRRPAYLLGDLTISASDRVRSPATASVTRPMAENCFWKDGHTGDLFRGVW
jgi:hypothetical protein